jgi:hypothetical protein
VLWSFAPLFAEPLSSTPSVLSAPPLLLVHPLPSVCSVSSIFRTFLQVPYPCKFFVCHSYENCGGVHPQFPSWNSSPDISLFPIPFLIKYLQEPVLQPLSFHIHPGIVGYGGVLSVQASSLQTILSSHCGTRTLVPQSAKGPNFFAIRGNNSAPPGV